LVCGVVPSSRAKKWFVVAWRVVELWCGMN
jgi:hypothetical protein